MDSKKTNHNIIQFSALTPLAYIAYVGLFYLFATIMEGHFPSYGNPDPKNYSILYYIEIILMLFVCVSFFFWIILITYAIIINKWKLIQMHFLLWILGMSLIFLQAKFDPLGVLNWLAD